MILGGDFDLPRARLLNGLVGAPVPKLQLVGLRAEGEGQELVPEANSENRFFGPDQLTDVFDRVFDGLRIARTVGEKDSVRFCFKELLGRPVSAVMNYS